MQNVIVKIPTYGLLLIYIVYLIMVLIYMFIVNNRLEMVSGEISKVYIGQYGGGVTGSKYNSYYIKNEDFFLRRRYSYFPSLSDYIEQRRAKVGNRVLFYIDNKESRKQIGVKRRMFVPIGLSKSDKYCKNWWYFVSLFSYTVKNTFIFIITFLMCMFVGYYLHCNQILYNSSYAYIIMIYVMLLVLVM